MPILIGGILIIVAMAFSAIGGLLAGGVTVAKAVKAAVNKEHNS